MNKILLVEDSVQLLKTLHESLPLSQYKTRSARSVSNAYSQLADHKFDLLVVDRHLPDGDGLEIVEHLQKNRIETPILILTELNSLLERVRGLRGGADDYLGKPFALEEFQLRVERLIQKVKRLDSHYIKVGCVRLDPETGMVFVSRRPIRFRKREFEILSFLFRHKNTVISPQMLIENVWQENELPTLTTINVYIRRIRLMLGRQSKIIRTLRGYGYLVKD